MNLIHVIPTFYPATAYGGPPEAVYRLCEALGKAGHRMLVLTTNGNGRTNLPATPAGRVDKVGTHVEVSYAPRLCWESVSFSLLRQIARRITEADSVMLSGVYSFPTIPTLLIARLRSKRLLWMAHGSLTSWSGARRNFAKRLWLAACKLIMPQSLCFVAASEAEREGIRRHFPTAAVAIVPFGVSLPQSSSCRKARAQGRVRLLYIGRLHPIKGIENALLALGQLVASGIWDWELVIAGTGSQEYLENLQAIVSAQRLEGSV